MSDEDLLENVRWRASTLASIDKAREKAKRERDEAVQEAHAAGYTHRQLMEAAGVTIVTVGRALKRR